jgi:putative ABC transport system permease protein
VQFRVEGGSIGSQSGNGLHTFSYPACLTLLDCNTVFTGVTGQVVEATSLAGRDGNDALPVGLVAGSYLDTPGVKVRAWRFLTDEDDRVRNGSPVAVRQYDSRWERSMHNADIVGSTMRLNGSPFTVVGIVAEGFEGPTSVFRRTSGSR